MSFRRSLVRKPGLTRESTLPNHHDIAESLENLAALYRSTKEPQKQFSSNLVESDTHPEKQWVAVHRQNRAVE